MSRASFLRRIDLSKNYITQIVEEVNSVTEHCGPVLLFGENIDIKKHGFKVEIKSPTFHEMEIDEGDETRLKYLLDL